MEIYSSKKIRVWRLFGDFFLLKTCIWRIFPLKIHYWRFFGNTFLLKIFVWKICFLKIPVWRVFWRHFGIKNLCSDNFEFELEILKNSSSKVFIFKYTRLQTLFLWRIFILNSVLLETFPFGEFLFQRSTIISFKTFGEFEKSAFGDFLFWRISSFKYSCLKIFFL